MKVNIVTEELPGRIKRRISEKIVKYNTSDIEYSISNPPRNDVDLNFYNCYNEYLFWGPSKVKNVCYVTHIHKTIEDHQREIGKSFELFNTTDGFLHQGQRTLDQFKLANIGQDKYHEVVWNGIESERFNPTITLGIIQNGEVEGKGLFFINRLLDKYDFKNFKFIFQGIGWDIIIKKMQKLKIRVEHYPTLDYINYPNIYEKLDYLFIPSLWEGGPMAVLEAMYCGLPIISSDTGWTKEISRSYLYESGNIDNLISLLHEIENKDIIKYSNLERYSCTEFSNRLATSFKRIIS